MAATRANKEAAGPAKGRPIKQADGLAEAAQAKNEALKPAPPYPGLCLSSYQGGKFKIKNKTTNVCSFKSKK